MGRVDLDIIAALAPAGARTAQRPPRRDANKIDELFLGLYLTDLMQSGVLLRHFGVKCEWSKTGRNFSQ
jgi:hypothetical protein